MGGPSTSGADFRECKGRVPYVEAFLEYCNTNQLPVDFVSAHPYPTYWPLDTEGVKLMGYMDEFATVNHLKAIRGSVMNSSYKNAEIHLTEWNSSPSPRDLVHDTAFMAPYIIDNNIKGIGLVDSLGFWTFTDIFEENGAGDTLFHGGFGLINLQGLKKASYYGYWFLSRLGSEKIACGDNYFVTKKDGKIVVLLWNYCHYKEHFANGDRSELNLLERYDIFEEKEISINLKIEGLDGNYKILKYVFGRNNGSAYDVWVNNSAPNYPTQEDLNIISKKVGPEGSIDYIKNVNVFNQEFILKSHDVVLIELTKQL